jgi:hypothetical protein
MSPPLASTADATTAVATVVLAVIAVVSAIIGFLAIWSAREENRRWNNLNVCAQHEFNSTVTGAVRSIETAFVNGVPDIATSKGIRCDAYVLLNYLDGIAIGVKQGLYIEKLAKDHLKTIVHLDVQRLLGTTFAENVPLDKGHWSFLVAMADKWSKDEPYYGEPWLRKFLKALTGQH